MIRVAMENVSVLGCGWLGKELAITLINNGCEVKGSTTSEEKTADLKSVGIQPFLVDISKENKLTEFLNSEVLVIAITSKSIDDFKRLISEIEKSTIKKVVFISSTSVYPSLNKEMTEEDETIDSPLATIEKLFIENTNFKTTIIRFAGLFGGSRHPGNWFSEKKVPNPNGFVNMIHREDCIAIIEKIIENNTFGEVFNACSSHHPTRKEFYINARKNLGKSLPEFDNTTTAYKIINSDKLTKQLNYQFKHDDLLAI